MPPIRRIVFCDFDGTITAEESLVKMFEFFAPGVLSRLEQKIKAERLSIREAVLQLAESIPSKKYPEILEFVRTKKIRTGLPEFLDFLEAEGVPFVIISGGLHDMVTTSLGPLVERIHAIHAAEVDTKGNYLKVISDYEGETELVEKVAVMTQYDFEESVAIGNGITDQNMALNSSIVFARNGLARHLDKIGWPYKPWNNFLDIRDLLAKRWQHFKM